MTGFSARVVPVLVLLLVSLAMAQAQQVPSFDPERIFMLGDADLDGRLSLDECRELYRSFPRMKDAAATIEPLFRRLDTDREGFLSLKEYRKAFTGRPGGAAVKPGPAKEKPPEAGNMGASATEGTPITPEQEKFVEAKIRPVLATHCGKCHAHRREAAGWTATRQWKFRQHGQSGLWISELFPEVAAHADKLCVVRGMHTDLPAHPETYLMLHTGSSQFIRPSLGAWTLYGLGTESDDLPAFIAIKPTGRNGGAQNYGCGFLPAACQANRIGNEGLPIAEARLGNIKNSKLDAAAQRLQLDLVQSMNRGLLEGGRINPGVEGVIESYELAFRMQGKVPDVMDLLKESRATKKLYGLDDPATADFGQQCLLARRFVEAGVRFVELTHGDWDQHRGLKAGHARNARAVDRPIAGLLMTDVKGMVHRAIVG